MTSNDTTLDLRFLDRVTYVASRLLFTDAGPVLLDTGPGSTLATLERGLAEHGVAVGDLHAILLSHIHFDHAGATGLLVERNPRLTVYVHERGTRHLSDPSKLIASATRIYGDDMDRLWGKLLPVPESAIRPLVGGETITFGHRTFQVGSGPGHAVHHVTYFEAADRTAYIGDCGGIRIPQLPIALPVTPPPDFNLDDWLATLDRIEAWQPRRLFVTHYGFSDDPARHLVDLRRGLVDWSEKTRELLTEDLPEAVRADRFHDHVTGSLAGRADPAAIAAYSEFSDFRASYHGIARYWRKRAETAAADRGASP